jgi:hypothetical protein
MKFERTTNLPCNENLLGSDLYIRNPTYPCHYKKWIIDR